MTTSLPQLVLVSFKRVGVPEHVCWGVGFPHLDKRLEVSRRWSYMGPSFSCRRNTFTALTDVQMAVNDDIAAVTEEGFTEAGRRLVTQLDRINPSDRWRV